MTFLKKLGQILAEGGAIVAQLLGLPFVSSLLNSAAGGKVVAGVTTAATDVQEAASDLSAIASILAMFETGATSAAATAGGTSAPGPVTPAVSALKLGPQKLAMAAPNVQNVLDAWAIKVLPSGTKLLSPSQARAGATAVASGLAQYLEAYSGDALPSVPKA